MLKNLPLNLLFLLIGIILGIYFNIFIENYIPLNFSNTINLTINPSIILSTLVTVAVAYYVARVLSQQNEKEKQERLLLIEYFKDFQTQCTERVNKILDYSSFNAAVFSEFKFLRTKLNSSIKLSEQQNFVSTEISSKLHDTLTSLWELLTDESNYENRGIKAEHKSSVNNKMIEIDESIFKIIVEINKVKK